MRISGYLNQYKQDRADNVAFRKKTALARREAFREESIKVAKERGRRFARRKGFSEILFPNAYPKAKAKTPIKRRKVSYVYVRRKK
jgi:hypothetical protein